MNATTAALLVIAVFAVVLLYALYRYRGRVHAKVKGPFGTAMNMTAEDAAPTPAVRGSDLMSRDGAITGVDHTGRGVDVRRADAKKDIRLEVEDSEHPKGRPRS